MISTICLLIMLIVYVIFILYRMKAKTYNRNIEILTYLVQAVAWTIIAYNNYYKSSEFYTGKLLFVLSCLIIVMSIVRVIKIVREK
mgnify:FL=1